MHTYGTIYGTSYNPAYVASPAGGGVGTDSNAVARVTLDTIDPESGGAHAAGQNVLVGVKLRSGSRIIAAELRTVGTLNTTILGLEVTDAGGDTALTGTRNGNGAGVATMTAALSNAGGYVCNGEGTLSVTGASVIANASAGTGVAVTVVVWYLDI